MANLPNIRDYFQDQTHFGLQTTADNLPAVQSGTSLYSGAQATQAEVDNAWARAYNGSATMNPYYDYFYSGQDISCFVDGTEEDAYFKTLPLGFMAYNVEQVKQPVFGFWSYTYDAVLRGTRVVSGQFSIVTRTTNYMTELLSKAAQARQQRLGSVNYNYNRGLTEDDKNIEAYWGKNRYDATVAAGSRNMFSVHPPFSFVIVYGIQNISVNNPDTVAERYASDNPLMLDTNERLVESDVVNQSNRIVLDACEITGMSTRYDTDGTPVGEVYNFFARDLVTP